MPIWDHIDELRERVIVAALAAATAVLTCFVFSKDLVVFLEAPVAEQGVRFLQLSPGEFFFTTIKARPASCMPWSAILQILLLNIPTVFWIFPNIFGSRLPLRVATAFSPMFFRHKLCCVASCDSDFDAS